MIKRTPNRSRRIDGVDPVDWNLQKDRAQRRVFHKDLGDFGEILMVKNMVACMVACISDDLHYTTRLRFCFFGVSVLQPCRE